MSPSHPTHERKALLKAFAETAKPLFTERGVFHEGVLSRWLQTEFPGWKAMSLKRLDQLTDDDLAEATDVLKGSTWRKAAFMRARFRYRWAREEARSEGVLTYAVTRHSSLADLARWEAAVKKAERRDYPCGDFLSTEEMVDYFELTLIEA